MGADEGKDTLEDARGQLGDELGRQIGRRGTAESPRHVKIVASLLILAAEEESHGSDRD